MEKVKPNVQGPPPWITTKTDAADQVLMLIKTGFPSLLNVMRVQLHRLAAESGYSVADLRRLVRLEIDNLLDSQNALPRQMPIEEEEPIGDPEPTIGPVEGATTSEEVHKKVLAYLAGKYGPDLYRDFTHAPEQIAEEVGVSPHQLRDWMIKMLVDTLRRVPTDDPIDVIVEFLEVAGQEK